MSKSKGNLIAPEHYFDTVGADVLRLFHLFVGPPFDDMDWSEQTEQVIEGCGRFFDRLWRICTAEQPLRTGEQTSADLAVRQAVHRAIADVTRDLERWSYNTAVRTAWSCSIWCSATAGTPSPMAAPPPTATGPPPTTAPHADVWNEALDALLLLLAVMSPHVTAELWEHRHPGEPSVHLQRWPSFDPDLVRQDTVTMVVQVNGKVRDRIEVDAGDLRGRRRSGRAGFGQGDRCSRRCRPEAGRGPPAAPRQRRRIAPLTVAPPLR